MQRGARDDTLVEEPNHTHDLPARYALGLGAAGLPLYAIMRLRRRVDPSTGVLRQ